MKLYIVNHTSSTYGAHPTTILVNRSVNARLRRYGAAVEEVWVTVLYRSRSRRPKTPHPFSSDFWRVVDKPPRATFYRTKRRIDVRFVSRRVTSGSINRDGHLTADELAGLLAEVAAALELIRPRVRPADDLDVERFLADARAALARCPAALRKVLGRDRTG
jgi:hypothetical protein